jgi:nucleoside-diphosphate-sugar epimerase
MSIESLAGSRVLVTGGAGLIGSTIVDQLQERRDVYGVNYVTVQQGELERFAPVVARLAGQ